MKKLILMMVSSFIILGCASGTLPNGNPKWTLNPPKSDTLIYGVGESTLSSASRAKQQATTQARAQIAGFISVALKSGVTDYYQENGGDDSQVTSFYEQVTREVSDETLNGTTVEEYFFNEETQTYFALVSLPKANIVEKAKESFVRNEGSAFAEFKADEAVDYLNKELGN